MTSYGVKISKPGVDVKTAKGNELVFASEYPMLKIKEQGMGSKTFTNNEGTQKLSDHNLGYIPFFNIWVNTGSGYKMTPFGETQGDFWIGYLGSARDNDLHLIAVATYIGGAFGDPTLPANKTVDYAWIIYYDPTQ